MSSQPGCPCSICAEDGKRELGMSETETESDNQQGLNQSDRLSENLDTSGGGVKVFLRNGAGAGTDVRDRIAKTIYLAADPWEHDFPWESLADHVKVLYREQADAVIAELGLTEEISIVHEDGPRSRYVTDWKADDGTS